MINVLGLCGCRHGFESFIEYGSFCRVIEWADRWMDGQQGFSLVWVHTMLPVGLKFAPPPVVQAVGASQCLALSTC